MNLTYQGIFIRPEWPEEEESKQEGVTGPLCGVPCGVRKEFGFLVYV